MNKVIDQFTTPTVIRKSSKQIEPPKLEDVNISKEQPKEQLKEESLRVVLPDNLKGRIEVEVKTQERLPEPMRTPSLLSQFRFNSSYPFVSRAALRGIGSSLNFSLVTLVSQHLRNLKFGTAAPEVDEHFGHTVDQRNELDHEIEGQDFESRVRESQGYALALPPLELAARLKVIRDSVAAELDQHAGLRMNPLTGKLFKNPYDLVNPISDSMKWILEQPARINEAQVQDAVKVLGIDEQSIRIHLERQHLTQQKFLRDNAAEIFTIIDGLTCKGEDGHELGIDDDETIEERLPAMNRARLFLAADKGLIAQRQREVSAYMRGNPNARGNIEMIDKEREQLHAKFDRFMKVPYIKDEINEAVSRGAQYPALPALFQLPKQAA